MEKIMDIEQQINVNMDLLKIAKDYCEFNVDNSRKICSLMSLIEIILQNQKSIVSDFDKLTLN